MKRNLLLLLLLVVSVGGRAQLISANLSESHTWKFVNTDGELLSPDSFVRFYTFNQSPFEPVEMVGFAEIKGKGYALVDKNGRLVTKPVYEGISSLWSSHISVTRKGKKGYIDFRGKEVIPCIYEVCGRMENGLVAVGTFDKRGVVDSLHKKVLPLKYTDIRVLSKLILVEKDGFWAVCDHQGNFLTGFDYTRFTYSAETDRGGVIGEKGDLYVYISPEGREVVALEEDLVIEERDEYVVVKEGYTSRYFTYEGEEITDKGSPYRFTFSGDSLVAYYEDTGERVLNPDYGRLNTYFVDGLAIINVGNRMSNPMYGVINTSGKIVIPFEYKSVERVWKYGLFKVAKSGSEGGYGYSYALCRADGTFLTDFEYDKVENLYDDVLLHCRKDGLYGLVDSLGHVVLPFEYPSLEKLPEDMGTAIKDDKRGLVDMRTGELVTPLVYDDIPAFLLGYAVVEKDDLYGVIDRQGNEVLPCSYEKINIIGKNRFVIKKDYRYGVIDQTGKEIIPVKYREIGYFYEGLLFLQE